MLTINQNVTFCKNVIVFVQFLQALLNFHSMPQQISCRGNIILLKKAGESLKKAGENMHTKMSNSLHNKYALY